MTADAGAKAYAALKAALEAAVAKFRAMGQPEFVQACVDLWLADGLGLSDGEGLTLEEAMYRLAVNGSIDAVGALVVMGATEGRVVEAMRAVAERSPDVIAGLQVETLAAFFEEWADGEVAAGRMRVTINEEGRKVYWSEEKK